jgi:HSP20 family molecular chaperone IbpA
VEVHVLQGERPPARDNRTLGRVRLVGLPSAPRGVPQIDVTFDVDASGIVNVSAKDRAMGKEQKITVTASSGLSKQGVDRLVKEAQSHAEEDRRRREEIERRNEEDARAYASQHATQAQAESEQNKVKDGDVIDAEPVETTTNLWGGRMTLTQWNPLRDVSQLQDRINRLFIDTYGRNDDALMTAGTWLPPVDIYQNGNDELVIKAELPDMKREDVEITVDSHTLTIKGEKQFTEEVKDDQFHRIERRYGTFSRSFALPPTVDAAKVSAEYKNGLLTLKLPLREEAKPRQIPVQVAA